MKFLDGFNPFHVSESETLDKGSRNPWKWHWLDEVCDKNVRFGQWCKNIAETGKCFCVGCHKVIVYGSAGKKALRSHANHQDHKTKMNSVLNSTKLISQEEDGGVCVTDRVNEVKAVMSLFMAEHCLPFSMAPALLDFAKRLGKDVKTMSSLTLNRTAATYNTCHGVAHDIKASLGQRLQNSFCSLNIDEATNNAGNKFLNVMVQYFDELKQQNIVQLLGAKEVNISSANNIVAGVEEVLKERGVEWSQVVSVLMDNCNVMRGKKTGVETQLRAKYNVNILDVNGDTVHTLNNAVKKFFSPIEEFLPLQTLCSDIFYDIEESPKVKEIFGLVQMKLLGKTRTVIRPIPSRFNQMLVVSNRMFELWEALQLYYSCFLEREDMKNYGGMVDGLFQKLKEEDRGILKEVLRKQRDQSKTNVSSERKARIIHLLFDKKEQTCLVLNLYRGILAKFEKFIKKFQSTRPLALLLHVEIFNIVKEFYGYFIKPEHIPLYDAKKLNALDHTNDKLHLNKSSLYVGEYCKTQILFYSKDKATNGQWLASFYCALKSAFLACAQGMKKLPLLNDTLIQMSHLSPGCQRSSKTGPALLRLAEKLPNVINPVELGKLDAEVKSYTTDGSISLIEADEDDRDFRLDTSWWCKIFQIKEEGELKYPTLGKLVKALMSVFCGPLVEASFNIMDDILESDRSRLTSFNYEALAMIKSHFIGHKETTSTFKISSSMKSAVGLAYSRYNRFLENDSSSSSHCATSSDSGNSGSVGGTGTGNIISGTGNSRSVGGRGNGTSDSGNSRSVGGRGNSDSGNSRSVGGRGNSISGSGNSSSVGGSGNSSSSSSSPSVSADTRTNVDNISNHKETLKRKPSQSMIGSFFAKKPRLQ